MRNPLNPVKVMSKREVADVLADLHRRARRSRHSHMKLVIFRLTVGAGLRVSEIAALIMSDVCVSGDRPHISIRKEISKRNKARTVPLWWDAGTHEALRVWKQVRETEMKARPNDPFLCLLDDTGAGATLNQPKRPLVSGRSMRPSNVYAKWMSAIRCLGPERKAQLHPHCGRHTYASYMVKERGLVAVRDALGHCDIAMTSIYLHVQPEQFDRQGSVFESASDDEPPPDGTISKAPRSGRRRKPANKPANRPANPQAVDVEPATAERPTDRPTTEAEEFPEDLLQIKLKF